MSFREMDASAIKKYHDLAFKEKTRYLEFIYTLGESNLKKIFRFPGENFSFWWSSLIAEKSPGKSQSYQKLISLLNNGRLEKPRSFLEIFSIFILFFKGLYIYFTLLLRIVKIRFSLGVFRKTKDLLKGKECVVVSYFPLMDERKAANNIFENKFIAPFHRALEEYCSSQYAHVCLPMDINAICLKEAITLLKGFGKKQTVFFIEEFFKPKHIFKIIFFYIYFSSITILNLRKIKSFFTYKYQESEIDIWHLFKNDFINSFSGTELISSLWYFFLFNELARTLEHECKIIVICEMHNWEKLLYINAKKYGLSTIGFQHSHIPELLLNYFNYPKEIGGNDFMKYCPLPDYIATTGRIGLELFRKYGWPESRIFIWGAQRFEALKDFANSDIPWDKRKDILICAFSIMPDDAQRVLILLNQAYNDQCNYRIILKPHPSLNLASIMKKINIKLNTKIFELSYDSLDELIACAKGLIVTDSSACFYALASNIPIITPRFPDKIDYNPLSYITNIPIYVYSPQELRSACDRIIFSNDCGIAKDIYKEAFARYLHFNDSEEIYLQKIDNIFHFKAMGRN